MFNDTVSMLTSFSDPPKDIRLADWLHKCMHHCEYTPACLDYRTEPSRQKKESMPSVIVGARCVGGHASENIVDLTGWVSIDIDQKHNPGITDWPGVRDELAKVKYIAFSGLSLSMSGVWCLVKVSHPDKLKGHFRAFKRDFERIGLNLDTSKGENANDKRFYSYDPDAIIKDKYIVFDDLIGDPPTITQKKSRIRYSDSGDIFEQAKRFVENRGYNFTNGNMHFSIYRLCCFLNRKGIPQDQAETWIDTNIISLHDVKSNCISYPYTEYAHEHGAGIDHASEGEYEAFSTYQAPTQYPADWDSIDPPEPDTPEYSEMVRAESNETGISHSRQIRNEAESSQGVGGHINALIHPGIFPQYAKQSII